MKPTIEERKNGPLVVKDVQSFALQDGNKIEPRPVMALCRCGFSKTKPFCDGSHKEQDFQDRGGKPDGPDRVFRYEGSETTVTFNPRLCGHAAECGRIASNIFNTKQKPWVQPDNGSLAEVEAVVAACPSGALKIATPEGIGPDLFAERPDVVVQKDGPYWVVGIDPPAELQGEGMTAGKYMLCRCGKSGTKPFCDGSHRAEGWRDDS